MDRNTMKTIDIYEGKQIHKIELRDIVYFMADGKCSMVFFMDKSYIRSTKGLKYYHDQLHEKENFYRIHRKYLVNVIHIVRIEDASETRQNKKQTYLSEKHRLKLSSTIMSIRAHSV